MSFRFLSIDEVSAFVRNGASIKQEKNASGLPITRIETIAGREVNLQKCGYAGIKEDEYLNYRLANGDILVSHINSERHLGKCAIYEGDRRDIVHGMNLLCVRPNATVVYPRYLFHYFSSDTFLRLIPAISKKSVNQASFTVSAFKELKVPLPDLREQKRIAAILDKADSIRRKRQQAIQLADDFLRSVFLEMFGDPVSNPKGWLSSAVGETCESIVPGRDKPKSFTGGTPWITTKELSHLRVTYRKNDSLGLSDSEIQEVRARVIPARSVLMTCVGDLGVVSIAGEDMVVNQQLHAFVLNESVTPYFLCYALSFQKDYMLRMASSTTVPYMNKTVCNSVPIILPPVLEQERFEKIAEATMSIRTNLEKRTPTELFESLAGRFFVQRNSTELMGA